MWASERPTRPLLTMNRRLWRDLIRELGRRGEGQRESGAFLLARPDEERKVTRIEYYDDLDPNCLRGHIHLQGRAYDRLWAICSAEGLRVVADIHTHPGASVRQSAIDRSNPMIASPGHVALIVPRLAVRRVRTRRIGVHQYRGDAGWMSWFGREAAARVSLRRWR